MERVRSDGDIARLVERRGMLDEHIQIRTAGSLFSMGLARLYGAEATIFLQAYSSHDTHQAQLQPPVAVSSFTWNFYWTIPPPRRNVSTGGRTEISSTRRSQARPTPPMANSAMPLRDCRPQNFAAQTLEPHTRLPTLSIMYCRVYFRRSMIHT